ncbi:MAG: protein translocase subunit SecD [Ignavibacteriales bacterium]|nr:protein translocase subunit SecD [Ignavibacteriales bacterium]
MKKFRFRIIIILGAIALSVYLLHYTYADYRNSKYLEEIRQKTKKEVLQKDPSIERKKLDKLVEGKIDSIRMSDKSYIKDREKRIKLGLDLQGGMYMVMEVNTVKLLEKLARDPDEVFKQVLKQAENESKLTDADVVSLFTQKLKQKGIRLSRYFGTIRDDDDKIVSKLKEQSEDAVKRAQEIIRNRVDQYGVSEPGITRQGSRRIIIELPGIAKEEEARQLLQGSALLEFKLVKEPEFAISIMQKVDEVLAGNVTSDSLAADSSKLAKDKKNLAAENSKAKTDTSKKELSKEEFAKKHPFFAIAMINPQARTAEAYVKDEERVKLDMMLNRPEVLKVMPNNVEFLYSAKPILAQDGSKMYTLFMVNKTPELTGGVITDAQANIDPQTSSPIVTMQMNSEGARDWARITGSNIGKRIAIVLDNGVYSAPTVQGKIPSGNSQISGMPNLEEAKLIEIVLKAGALPAPVNIIEERTVGPSLGEDSISQGFNSAVIGFLMVALFMFIIYTRVGIIADIALFFAILFIFGFLAGFNATLTLPGIAGIVLTMGMAVDANVLIYERIREELAVGKTMKAAIDSGFKFSFATVIDSHVTTLITGIILYQFGTGPVQGFALTLIIGIFTSLFGALVISRVILDFMVEKGYKISLG